MAKVKGPLFSVSAHGKLGKSLIYSHPGSGQIARNFHMPHKKTTLKQWTQRHIIGLLTAHWQIKTTSEKLIYENLAKASGMNISGFNYFVKIAQTNLYAHHGLCGYWSMNEPNGIQVKDYSGNGNHGVLMPTYPTNCPERITSFKKEYGNALYFNGTEDYVEAPDTPTLNPTTAITMEVLIKTTGNLEGYARIISKRSPGSAYELILNTTSGALQVYIYTPNGSTVVDGNTNVQDGKPHYAAVTREETVLNIYIDDYLDKAATVQPGSTESTSNLFFGRYPAASIHFFKDMLDEIRIYNRGLSAAEVLKHYNLLRLDKQRQPLLIH
jgi:hypothetical protein